MGEYRLHTRKRKIAYLGCGGILMNSPCFSLEMHSDQIDTDKIKNKDSGLV